LKNGLINGYFEFDKSLLTELLELDSSNIRVKLNTHMSKLVIITEETLKMDSVTFSCRSGVTQKHCKGGKLLISAVLFSDCINMLTEDIQNPYRREYILQLAITPINPFLFTQRENEIINIYQI
jgi:hypothetical protein